MSAEAIRDFYLERPEATLPEVAEDLELDVSEVHRIMDTHLVTEEGIEEVGPGQGGGWVPEAEMVSYGQEIGYRWPDGELREDPFEIDNPLHRQLMNLPSGVTEEASPQ